MSLRTESSFPVLKAHCHAFLWSIQLQNLKDFQVPSINISLSWWLIHKVSLLSFKDICRDCSGLWYFLKSSPVIFTFCLLPHISWRFLLNFAMWPFLGKIPYMTCVPSHFETGIHFTLPLMESWKTEAWSKPKIIFPCFTNCSYTNKSKSLWIAFVL